MSGWMDQMAGECIKRGAPAGWTIAVSSLLGNYPKYTHYQFEGAVYGRYVKGPKKGRINYSKPFEGTRMTFILSIEEVRAIPVHTEPAA